MYLWAYLLWNSNQPPTLNQTPQYNWYPSVLIAFLMQNVGLGSSSSSHTPWRREFLGSPPSERHWRHTPRIFPWPYHLLSIFKEVFSRLLTLWNLVVFEDSLGHILLTVSHRSNVLDSFHLPVGIGAKDGDRKFWTIQWWMVCPVLILLIIMICYSSMPGSATSG